MCVCECLCVCVCVRVSVGASVCWPLLCVRASFFVRKAQMCRCNPLPKLPTHANTAATAVAMQRLRSNHKCVSLISPTPPDMSTADDPTVCTRQ